MRKEMFELEHELLEQVSNSRFSLRKLYNLIKLNAIAQHN